MLIAKVTVKAHDGTHPVEFSPGKEIPEGVLCEHDVKALLEAGAIEDTEATAAAKKDLAKAAAEAGDEFKQARDAVKAAGESTKPGAGKKAGAKDKEA